MPADGSGRPRNSCRANLSGLLARPVYLFSSGPLGDSGKPEEVPADGARVRDATGAREHRVFAGRLEPHDLSFGERAILSVVRAPHGDFRPWSEIESWAAAIAQRLQADAADEIVGRPVAATA